jgi:hypothetical protein
MPEPRCAEGSGRPRSCPVDLDATRSPDNQLRACPGTGVASLGVEAPGWQGATSAQSGTLQATSNARQAGCRGGQDATLIPGQALGLACDSSRQARAGTGSARIGTSPATPVVQPVTSRGAAAAAGHLHPSQRAARHELTGTPAEGPGVGLPLLPHRVRSSSVASCTESRRVAVASRWRVASTRECGALTCLPGRRYP